MNREQYLWGKVAEEASELAQAALKCQQFGKNEEYKKLGKNIERFLEELTDVVAVVGMLQAENPDVDFNPDEKALKKKIDKVEFYLNKSIELGQTEVETKEGVVDGNNS